MLDGRPTFAVGYDRSLKRSTIFSPTVRNAKWSKRSIRFCGACSAAPSTSANWSCVRAIFKDDYGGVSFEVVQTGGDDPPDYFVPKMRRI